MDRSGRVTERSGREEGTMPNGEERIRVKGEMRRKTERKGAEIGQHKEFPFQELKSKEKVEIGQEVKWDWINRRKDGHAMDLKHF